MSRITIMLGDTDNSGDQFTISSGSKIRFMNTTKVAITLTTGAGFDPQVPVDIAAAGGARNANRSKKFSIERGATILEYTWGDQVTPSGSSFATRRGTIKVT